MSRLILIGVIVVLVYLLLKSFRGQRAQKEESSATPQDMVACDYCNVNLPKSESVALNGKYYCCEAHSRGQADNQ